MITREFTLGDTITSLSAKLYRPNGSVVVLDATDTVAFRMVSSAGVVKVDDSPAVVVSVGSSATNTPAEVRYDWSAVDVDTAGTYTAWFVRSSVAGSKEHYPSQDPDDPELQVVIRARS